ncbi:IQ domain-containing protein E-like isoform X1 [Salvelinus fontinalis]|uniref:IQ domain-containing protein E-like isoform X1 n=2 Tax=Salvelinus fontinalis TaxID=8038 RepID=UPI0024856D8F|nr:IQ domain-containing protein E-like isoform X1 [Salvelinus fontinalis]XP_055770881.1 IQ domain-containing protein E-like isoform X1 [Salvelinus fontinalis]XP_055770882.1 IQ domain-containing protein E-like isoform X1 [Salvelinus fontinalis]
MSLVASDIPTDEDLEDLVEDGLSLATCISDSGKKARKKKLSGKPPPSPRSPYLSSMDVNPRRSAVSAWRPLRGTLGERGEALGGRGDTLLERGETARTPKESCLASLSNGHGLSQSLRVACLSSSPCTPDYLQQALGIKKPKHLHSSSNDYREKEDMYDEIIHLKKSLQAQKSEKDRMKAKLRRLEEDKTKKDKQIEQLLDPTKGPEYTLGLVDKKHQGSLVVNGLKQRILKLEQQCREKENTVTKLQSELQTTNLEELKITVETYFEEIQRLRMILDATEKSSRAENKGSQRKQKVLSSTVLRLSENLKQLQQENHTLREELNTDIPASGLKAYKDWSKQRVLRRLVELETRLEEGRRAPARRSGVDRLVQTDHHTTPTETGVATTLGITTVTTEGGVAVVNTQQEGEGFVRLKGCVKQLEQEKAELQETLTDRERELRRLMAEREQEEEETERRKNERRSEHEKETQLSLLEREQLTMKIQSLEEEKKRWTGEEQNQKNRKENPEGREEKEKAARVIQREWLEHRERDTVFVQSAIRGHLLRQSQIAHLQDTHTSTLSKNGQSQRGSDVTSCVEDEDLVAVTLIQSVFRGHLTRSALMTESSESPAPPPWGPTPAPPPCGPTPAPRRVPSVPSTHTPSNTALPGSDVDEDVTELSEEDPWPVSNTLSNRRRLTPAQLQLHPPPDSKVAKAMDSEDSDDDIIVSPSRLLGRREEIYF